MERLTRRSAFLALVLAGSAWAQEGPKPLGFDPTLKAPPKDAKKEKPKEGWIPFLAVGSNVSVGTSSSVVGKPDGTTVSLGANLNARFNYKKAEHEWANTVVIQVQQTRTPLTDQFVKSLDQFKYDSTYFYTPKPTPWLSGYVGFTLETQLFGGNDPRVAPVDYVITELNGTKTGDHGSNILLTHEFSPTTLTEGAGLAFKPVDRKEAKLVIRTGIGAVEAFTRNGVVITGTEPTGVVDLKRLQDYRQVGGQLRFDFSGAHTKAVTYSLFAELLFPFYNSVDTKLSGVDLIGLDFSFKLSFKPADWFSLDYVLGIRRQPLIVDALQVWNGLLVSFSYTLVK